MDNEEPLTLGEPDKLTPDMLNAVVRQHFPWNRDDVVRILKHIAESNPYTEDSQSCDYCDYCGRRSGNALLRLRGGERECDLHDNDCIYILAKDMLTGVA